MTRPSPTPPWPTRPSTSPEHATSPDISTSSAAYGRSSTRPPTPSLRTSIAISPTAEPGHLTLTAPPRRSITPRGRCATSTRSLRPHGPDIPTPAYECIHDAPGQHSTDRGPQARGCQVNGSVALPVVAECTDVSRSVMIDAVRLLGTVFPGCLYWSSRMSRMMAGRSASVPGPGTGRWPARAAVRKPRACTGITSGRRPMFPPMAAVSW